MNKGRGKLIFTRIKDRQFLKMFLKNWLLVFVCIVLPIVFCVVSVHHFAAKSLLKEMDTAATRSLSNTKATTDAMFNEICNNLLSKAMDDDVEAFISKKRNEPKPYDYVSLVQITKKRLEENYRESLYHSVAVYTEVGDYIVSAFQGASSYERALDRELIDVFFDLSSRMIPGSMCIVPRIVKDQKIMTIYYIKSVVPGRRSFLSVSIYTDEFIKYLSGTSDYEHGYSFLIDKEGKVLLDTSGFLYDSIIPLEDMPNEKAYVVNNVEMRTAWLPLESLEISCVQMIAMDEYQQSQRSLHGLAIMIMFSGIVAATFISYIASCRLYRPIEAILKVLDTPSDNVNRDANDEVQYILVSILDLFHKNTFLEEQMLERAISLRRVRAKALQAQMTPHFLYNVLQAINWNAIMETGSEDSKTSRSIMLLADLLSFGKEQKNNITTVTKEIDYVKKYMQLASFRYGPEIHCKYNIDECAKEMPIPCISLQTLVENSISHGLQPKGAKGNISISINADANQNMRIRVEDDGVGFSKEKIIAIYEMLEKEYIYTGNHVGIINLFQRFRLIYGDDCRFTIYNKEGSGACIDIFLPKLSESWLRLSHDK